MANLQEIDILRKENEVFHQQNLMKNQRILMRIFKTFPWKWSQTITVVEKETVSLNNFRDEQKEKISTLFKVKQLLDDHEKDLVGQQLD